MPKVIIMGGSLGGLTAALFLRERGGGRWRGQDRRGHRWWGLFFRQDRGWEK